MGVRPGTTTSEYTSWAFGHRLREAGLLGSMGSIGDCFDNSVAESFFATLQTELLDRSTWPTREGLANAIFAFVEGLCNPQRRHSTLGYLSPADHETQHALTTPAGPTPRPLHDHNQHNPTVREDGGHFTPKRRVLGPSNRVASRKRGRFTSFPTVATASPSSVVDSPRGTSPRRGPSRVPRACGRLDSSSSGRKSPRIR